ncbi:cuticle protein 18.6-like [Culicoides brevitarsis]|uniref:cuticle protein 18.6-like n=1 Tax=Culicoides brevitarsis TaxID=469753 RepID=UPI00307C85F3
MRFESIFVIFIAFGTSVVLAEYYHHHPESHEHAGSDEGHDVGYSYAKFSGPVSGPDHKIVVKDKDGHGESYDYVAKPDYHFEYGVEDPKSHVSQSRKEHRHGDGVVGEYSFAQPDGKIRTVKYNADKHNGFQAEVLIDGKPLHYEALQEQQAHLEAQKQFLASHEANAHQAQHYQPQPEHHVHHAPISHHGGDDERSYSGGYHGYSDSDDETNNSGEDEYSYYHK